MNASPAIKRRSYLQLPILSLVLLGIGCGGGSYSQPSPQPSPQPAPGPTPQQSMQGSWEMDFHSEVSPNDYLVLETNLSQAGTHVFAGATSALVYQGQPSNISLLIGLNRFGGKCESGGNDEITFDGTLTNQTSTTETVTFSLTETGALGSSVITASASTDGMSILNGTYSSPAACGFPEDHGTFTAFQDSPRYSWGSNYQGIFNSGADSILLHFTFESRGFGLTATGTDNGTPFVLSGSTVGISLTLTGTISNRAVTWFGLFDSTYNVFLFYDSDAKFLGSLRASPH